MEPFLQQVVRHYAGKTAPDGTKIPLDRWCFIFPNKRSQVFFRKYLADEVRASGVPVIAPKMLEIRDFLCRLGGNAATDRVTLLLELYPCYKALLPGSESLDDFIFWGDVLLSDFDDVDKYLVDAERLFTNVADFKSLQDDFSYLTEHQREAILHFVGNFRSDGALTVDLDAEKPGVKERFLRIWNLLFPLYRSFRARLEEKGMAYEGMVYRQAVARLRGEGTTPAMDAAFGPGLRYVFVGLNALSESERAVLKAVHKSGLAEFCWDFPGKMIADPLNKSSFYMRQNLDDFPPAFQPDPDGVGIPAFEAISAPSAVAQANIVPALLGDGADTAVVLPDESLLEPLLNAIPPQIADINVTMGYPMRNTAVYGFLTGVAAMQLHLRPDSGSGGWMFYHAQVWSLFSSGIFRRLTAGDEAVHALVARVKAARKYYIPEADLHGHPLLDSLFVPVAVAPKDAPAAGVDALCVYLQDLLRTVAEGLREDPALAVELDFALAAFRAVGQLRERKMEIRPATFFRLLDNLLSSVSVPFNGEPLRGLQIMGPLETRSLDFRRLFILSCNEGIFPRRSQKASFIPPELRKGFDLPTYEYQDAVWAYYFYRMVARAEQVYLIYDSRTEGVRTGEESRFIKQLSYHFNLPVRHRFVAAEAQPGAGAEPEIPKTEQDIQAIRQLTLSASSLKSYLDCPAQFYYARVAGLTEEDEVSEDLDASMVGNVYHATMQALYLGPEAMDPAFPVHDDEAVAAMKHRLREVDAAYLRTWLSRKADIKARVRSLILSELRTVEVRGSDLVTENVIVQYVVKTLERDLERLERSGMPSFRILGLERRFTMEMDGFRFIGFVDRMDSFLPGEVRVVDYKTGMVTDDDIGITPDKAAGIAEKLFGADNQKRPKIAFQVFLYDKMVARDPAVKDARLVNTIYQPSRLFVKPAEDVPADPTFISLVEEKLHGLLAELVDPQVGFRRTDDEKTCGMCAFKKICGR